MTTNQLDIAASPDVPPPHDLEAERGYLGALLIDSTTCGHAIDLVSPSDFYRHAHSVIFETVAGMLAAGSPVEERTVGTELNRLGCLEDVGGYTYLGQLTRGVPKACNIDSYASTIRAAATARAVTETLKAATQDALAGRIERAIERAGSVASIQVGSRNASPSLMVLRDLLGGPAPVVEYQIADWQPVNTRVILSAQFKAGKTTLRDNVVRCLADGQPFLGIYPVNRLSGTVAVLDTEMSESQMRCWLSDQRIVANERVLIAPLRGRAASLDLLNPRVRAGWAQRLRAAGVAYLVVDCLRPILDDLGLDEHRDAGRWLAGLDALLREARISDCLLIHHMGHTGERSRGDSRLRDWPDAEWRLVRQDDNPASPRFLTAFGRDVDVQECRLEFDATTRHLTVCGGSRASAKTENALDAVLNLLAQTSPLSGVGIKKPLMEHGQFPRADIEKALRLGALNGSLLVVNGAHGAKLYSASRTFPRASREGSHDLPSAYRAREGGKVTAALSVPVEPDEESDDAAY